MNFDVARAGLPDKFELYFKSDNCDIFHLPIVLNEIYGDKWLSILISENSQAFFHVYSPRQIGESEFYDIEPFLGYNGFIFNEENPEPDFVTRAFRLYSEYCKENKIVAEIVRFNTVLNNSRYFINEDLNFRIDKVKEIVVANCYSNYDSQINEFGKSRKRDIKTASKSLRVDITHAPFSYNEFMTLYENNLRRNNAKQEWYFSDTFFSGIAKNHSFYLFTATDQSNRIHSASIFILHTLCSYYFLAANNPPILPGANDFLIFEMCKFAAENGSGKLILGGGNTSANDDPLLLYKKKFNSQNHFLFLGKLVHDNEVFESLCSKILIEKPELASSNFFLKYRLG